MLYRYVTVVVLVCISVVCAVNTPVIETDEAVFGFTGLLSNSNETTKGWYFTGGQSDSISPVTLGNVTFTGIRPASTEGSNDILSWSSADSYDLIGFSWVGTPEQALDAMSVGGLWSGADHVMSINFDIPTGTEYIIELVSLQPFEGGIRTMDITIDGQTLVDNWWVNEDPYNKLLRVRGISDGVVNIDFSAGSVGDPAPALSIVTVTVVPEPATVALLGFGALSTTAYRRRKK